MEARAVTNLYEARVFDISRIEADQEFRCITNDLLPIPVNVAATDRTVSQDSQGAREMHGAGFAIPKDPQTHDKGHR
jgi:hypothetical protein